MDNKDTRSLVFFSRTGCLLPFLIIFNLFFGWMFLKFTYWLLLEAVLVLFFIISGYMVIRKIKTYSSQQDNVIDTQGEVIEDKHKLK